MKKSKSNIVVNFFMVLALFCFGLLIYRFCFLSMSPIIDGINLKDFASDRSIVDKVIKAKRGNIFDTNGEVMAENVSSYTLIAYLDPSRSVDQETLYHVEDKAKTAKELATVINMKEQDILTLLSQIDLYQVEFGTAGKSLTELEKNKIESLNLPGIDFIAEEKRYYPSGDFASYTLGYARKLESGKLSGELGIEALLEDVLAGKDGHITYQKDVNGYRIPGTKEIVTAKVEDGNDVYLTIDSNVQFFVEQAIKDAYKKYPAEWITIVVADAKSGAILGASQRPSFDPNVLDITNWLNLTSSSPYEPGSIMKIYTYMAAMEAGTYKAEQKFKSGKYVTKDGTEVYDWRRTGFGDITYDQGFMASSNVGVINIVNNFINKDILYNYFQSLGFGKKTGITMYDEQAGKLAFNYETETYNAAFGQGITTTPLQHIQALSAIANDGVMLNPYIIDKVVDSAGKVVFKGAKKEISTVASKQTTDKIKQLMYDTVHSTWDGATGGAFKINGYDIIGKTGTAQLVNPNTGKYYTSDYYTTKSFVGMWPKDDPQVIIYASVNKPENGANTSITTAVKDIIINVSKYLEIFAQTTETVIDNFNVKNYINQKTEVIEKSLKESNINYLILGNGDKIINQYPSNNSVINKNERIILLTNDISYTMPNIIGFSKKDARAVCNLLDIACTYEDYGYVKSQSISQNSILKPTDNLKLVFGERYKS